MVVTNLYVLRMHKPLLQVNSFSVQDLRVQFWCSSSASLQSASPSQTHARGMHLLSGGRLLAHVNSVAVQLRFANKDHVHQVSKLHSVCKTFPPKRSLDNNTSPATGPRSSPCAEIGITELSYMKLILISISSKLDIGLHWGWLRAKTLSNCLLEELWILLDAEYKLSACLARFSGRCADIRLRLPSSHILPSIQYSHRWRTIEIK